MLYFVLYFHLSSELIMMYSTISTFRTLVCGTVTSLTGPGCSELDCLPTRRRIAERSVTPTAQSSQSVGHPNWVKVLHWLTVYVAIFSIIMSVVTPFYAMILLL